MTETRETKAGCCESVADCCDSAAATFCMISRSDDGRKLVITIDPEKLPKQGDKTADGKSPNCCCVSC